MLHLWLTKIISTLGAGRPYLQISLMASDGFDLTMICRFTLGVIVAVYRRAWCARVHTSV